MRKAGHGADQPIAASRWPRTLFYLLQFTWGLPVNLPGLIAFLCCRRRFPSSRFHNSVVTRLPGNRGGLSLGVFIFLSVPNAENYPALWAHEYGHTIQCLLLGPLYWPVVALPSLVWYHCFAGWRRKHGIAYEALYCERWATAWGRRWSGAPPRKIRPSGP